MPTNNPTKPAPPAQAYIGLPEAAAYLGCDRKLLKRAMDDGRLVAYRLGTRVIRVKIADLEALLTPLPVRTGK